MSYSVVKNRKRNTYDIVEKDTNVRIKLEYDEKYAKQVCRKLNLGGGFNGYTPMFFAPKYDYKRGIIT